MKLADILTLYPRTNRQEYGPVSIHVIQSVLCIVLHHEDHGILPTGAMGNQIYSHAERRVIVLHKSRIGPRRTAGVDIERATAVIVRVVEIDVGGKVADVVPAIHILGLKNLFETAKSAET